MDKTYLIQNESSEVYLVRVVAAGNFVGWCYSNSSRLVKTNIPTGTHSQQFINIICEQSGWKLIGEVTK